MTRARTRTVEKTDFAPGSGVRRQPGGFQLHNMQLKHTSLRISCALAVLVLRDAGAADHRSSMAHMKCSGARCPERTNPIEVGPERTRSGGVDSASFGLKETAAWVS